MWKLAVLGAQTLAGRELVNVLESRDCSVLPLATGPLRPEEEEGELVVFAPESRLLEDLDLVILADTPQDPALLEGFSGRRLDLREAPDPGLDPIPLRGGWPKDVRALRGRPALEQVLAAVPALVEGVETLAGTHLRSVAHLGARGLEGLMDQTLAVLRGEEPDPTALGYRAAFELVPQGSRGHLAEVWTPVFHGDLLILHLNGASLTAKPAPEGCRWVDRPPTSRDVAVSPELLAHFQPIPHGGVLTLGFDPVLWGVLRPVLRLLEL